MGPEEATKQRAKEATSLKVLLEDLELFMPDEEDVSLRKAATMLSPTYALYQLLSKQDRKKIPDIVYDNPEDISNDLTPVFQCHLTVNGTNVFEGTGPSKKAAKSAAAEKALKQLFNFDLTAPNALEALTVKKTYRDDDSYLCNDVCMLVREQYETICHQQSCPITTHLSAFVLIFPDGTRHMFALGAGRNMVVAGEHLYGAKGNVLLHMESTVLARRALLLYFYSQLEHRDDPESVVELSPTSNKYRLKAGYKLALYISFQPNATSDQLYYYGEENRLIEADLPLQTFQDIYKTNMVNIMSIADKMLKWNHIGLQGALLSYILEPFFIDYLFVGSAANEKAVKHAVMSRMSGGREDALSVKSLRAGTVPRGEVVHNWVATFGTLERLDPSSGRTVTGSPSRLCKSELYESWARVQRSLNAEHSRTKWCYGEAKRNARDYQEALEDFITRLEENSLGSWQRKDAPVDDFQLVSFDD